MLDALLAVQLRVVSWPATTVCRFAESKIVGEPGGGAAPFPTELVSGAADPAAPHPTQRARTKTAATTSSDSNVRRRRFTTRLDPAAWIQQLRRELPVNRHCHPGLFALLMAP